MAAKAASLLSYQQWVQTLQTSESASKEKHHVRAYAFLLSGPQLPPLLIHMLLLPMGLSCLDRRRNGSV